MVPFSSGPKAASDNRKNEKKKKGVTHPRQTAVSADGQSSVDLCNGQVLLVEALCDICHQLLCAIWEFGCEYSRGAREDGKWRNDGLWRKHSTIKNTAAVLEHTTTPNDAATANVHKRADLCGIHHAILLNEHVISNVQWEEGNTFAEFFEWRADNTAILEHTVSANTYIGQISTDDAILHHNGLSTQYDVLTATEHRLSANLVTRSRFDEGCFVIKLL